ncbi:MAG: hypothetical protein ACTHK4_00920 [Mycobacteriales bacterium]
MSSGEGAFQPERIGRAATLLISAQAVFFLLFAAGGAVTIWTASRNGNNSVSCVNAFGMSCGHHHSYALGITMLVIGLVGLVITVAVGQRLAVGLGLGALAVYQRRRMSGDGALAMPTAPGAQADWVGGQPPGTPGSPTGPLL